MVFVIVWCQFHFLKVTWEVESDHISPSSHVYPSWLVNWVDIGGGCYKVASKHVSPLGLDGQCVLVMHSCQLHVFIILVIYMLVVYASCQSWL